MPYTSIGNLEGGTKWCACGREMLVSDRKCIHCGRPWWSTVDENEREWRRKNGIGQVAERPIASALKAEDPDEGSVGSNPTLSSDGM